MTRPASPTAELTLPGLNGAALALPRLDPDRQWRARWFTRAVSLALLALVAVQISALDLSVLTSLKTQHPGFWLAFLAMYFTLPVADLIIFRGLWGLPLQGFGPILRKRIGNELFLSYSGEVYFYFWARRHAGLTSAPFGAIKDVNILSALVANFATLALLWLAWPYMAGLFPGRFDSIIWGSVALVLALTMIAFFFRGRLFTLSQRQLVWVALVHLVRITLTTALLALVWHLAMPDGPIGLWLELSALRLVVMRLPMLPSKDLVFTGIAIFLFGSDDEIAVLIALTAGLTLVTHILLATVLAITGLFDSNDKPGEAA
ncbi:hypothetical protein [Blastomonas sp. AAP53]|uniref:hypothetical protein n=1 Tax=Blastomonas sp. AAP53 TaxID=1248760 RepID=UPI0003815BEA|nr:hypothetical protein [Blastomonas sp. AAP53]